MIEIKNLTYIYDTQQSPALENINLSIQPGEYVAIIGPNGGGKTTLIRQLNALLTPTQGEVWIDGLSTGNVKNHKEIRRLVGMIFQNPDNQIVGMTVEEDVAFGPGNLGLSPAEIQRRVDSALAAVGLSELGNALPIPVRRSKTAAGFGRSAGHGSENNRTGRTHCRTGYIRTNGSV